MDTELYTTVDDGVYLHVVQQFVQKKDLLIEAFHDLCDTTKHESLTLEIKMTIKNFINEDLETVIDSVIQLSKGEFKINEQQQKLFIKLALKACQCFMKQNEDTSNKRP